MVVRRMDIVDRRRDIMVPATWHIIGIMAIMDMTLAAGITATADITDTAVARRTGIVDRRPDIMVPATWPITGIMAITDMTLAAGVTATADITDTAVARRTGIVDRRPDIMVRRSIMAIMSLPGAASRDATMANATVRGITANRGTADIMVIAGTTSARSATVRPRDHRHLGCTIAVQGTTDPAARHAATVVNVRMV
jgi:hypothetical protein